MSKDKESESLEFSENDNLELLIGSKDKESESFEDYLREKLLCEKYTVSGYMTDDNFNIIEGNADWSWAYRDGFYINVFDMKDLFDSSQKKLDKANERILELEDEFNTAVLCWTDALDLEEKHRKKLDAANKLLLFNVKELDFQSQEAVRFKSELVAANEIIEKLKSGISAELKRCGGTIPILKKTLEEVEEMEDVN